MSGRLSDPRRVLGAPAREAILALSIGLAIVWLAGGSVVGQSTPAPKPGAQAAAPRAGGQNAEGEKPFDEFPDEFTYAYNNPNPEKRGITYRGKAPAERPTKPWTGKFLPDGQPDVAKSIWLPTTSIIYLDRAIRGVGTTKVADPPDGKVPYQPWALELIKTAGYDTFNPTKPWHVDPRSRCVAGVPHMYAYAQPYKIYQPPGYVVFTFSTFRFRRVIPLDGRPHLGSNIKLWDGDSTGHWDGNTLIVDTTNMNAYAARLDYMGGHFFSYHAHLTEKFIFEPADGSTMLYEATITDPTVFTRPWTMRVIQKVAPASETAANGELWEYQCGMGEESGTRPVSAPGTQPQ